MPSAPRFILKSSHPAIQEIATRQHHPIQGRRYDTTCAQQPGGVKATDLLLGMQFACVSITDDAPDTLKTVGALNPWQIKAMTMIAGSAAHEPLTQILQTQFGLETDHHINIHGVTKVGHPLDTQGYIAHNDEVIVLAYRCTTSAADWLTNLTTTTSAWEIEEDVAQGHSGFWSCCAGFSLCGGGGGDGFEDSSKPRVHTGFYNNFLVTVPLIRKYIDPLLFGEDQPPRTLYVCGHSLGGGIAAMAACYFLLEPEYDWEAMPHKLRVVTAGGPRALCKGMQQRVDNKLKHLRSTDKAVVCRLVRDKDAVPTVPPEMFNFRHITQKLVYITKEDDDGVGGILINPDLTQIVPVETMKSLMKEHAHLLKPEEQYGKPDETGKAKNEGDDDVKDDDGIETPFKKDGGVVNPRPSSAMSPPTPTSTMPSIDDMDTGSVESLDYDYEDMPEPSKQYQKIPRAIRDHMPQFYLRPLIHLAKEEKRGQSRAVGWNNDDSDDDDGDNDELFRYGAFESKSGSSSVDSTARKAKKKKGRLGGMMPKRNKKKNLSQQAV